MIKSLKKNVKCEVIILLVSKCK